MRIGKPLKFGTILGITLALAGCGNSNGNGAGSGLFSKRSSAEQTGQSGASRQGRLPSQTTRSERAEDAKIWDLFASGDDPNVTVEVNKYIWAASLDVLNFLPIEAADPFSGLIVTGYGTPPGGGRAYRATVLVQDPALDARSLNLSLQTRSGPVSRDTVQAVEDAILTRARQLRIADTRL